MKIFDPKLTGSIEFETPVLSGIEAYGGFTGSLFGTASYALLASGSGQGGPPEEIEFALIQTYYLITR